MGGGTSTVFFSSNIEKGYLKNQVIFDFQKECLLSVATKYISFRSNLGVGMVMKDSHQYVAVCSSIFVAIDSNQELSIRNEISKSQISLVHVQNCHHMCMSLHDSRDALNIFVIDGYDEQVLKHFHLPITD